MKSWLREKSVSGLWLAELGGGRAARWERRHQRRIRLETREVSRGLWVACGTFQAKVSNKKLGLRFWRLEELLELDGGVLGIGGVVPVDYSERIEKRTGRHPPAVTT